MKGHIVFKGGSGSGNFGHSGRPGQVGGSGAGSGVGSGTQASEADIAAALKSEVGLTYTNNKALQHYYKNGMSGRMEQLRSMYEKAAPGRDPNDYRGMAAYAYNKGANGSPMPGFFRSFTYDSFLHEPLDSVAKAFSEVRQSTLTKHAAALNLIDSMK